MCGCVLCVKTVPNNAIQNRSTGNNTDFRRCRLCTEVQQATVRWRMCERLIELGHGKRTGFQSRRLQTSASLFSVDRNIVALKGKPRKWQAHSDGATPTAEEAVGDNVRMIPRDIQVCCVLSTENVRP